MRTVDETWADVIVPAYHKGAILFQTPDSRACNSLCRRGLLRKLGKRPGPFGPIYTYELTRAGLTKASRLTPP